MKKSINTRWFYVLSLLLLTATFRPAELFAQDRLTLVSGTVVSESGAPVPGATVTEVGTTNGVATDRSGAFSISVREKSSLKISFVGYLDITVPAATAQTRFVLREDVVQINALVITGYGKKVSKDKLTASISKVGAEELGKGAHSSLLAALPGTMTGVRITNTSGAPGSAPAISIRGGTRLNGAGTPLYLVDGMQRSDLNDINPEDVESIEILKDAASTALYGARANNGVVMVTTKSGSVGKASVSVKASIGINFLPETYDFLGADDYLYWLRLAAYRSGNENKLDLAGPYGTGNDYYADGNVKDAGVYSPMFYTDEFGFLLDEGWKLMTDPITGKQIIYSEFRAKEDNVRKSTLTQNYTVSLSGGNDRGRYYSSLSYYDEDGFPLSTYYNRLSYTLNASYKVNKWLTSSGNFSFARSDQRRWSDVRDNGEAEFFGNMFAAPPTLRHYNPAGELIIGSDYYRGNWKGNIDNFTSRNTAYRYNIGTTLKADITRHLYAKVSASWYIFTREKERFLRKYQTAPGKYNENRNASASYARQLAQNYNALLGYENSWNGHNLSAVAGFEFYDKTTFGLSGSGGGGSSDDFGNLQYTQIDPGKTKMSTTHTQLRQMSAFVNASYDWHGKYLLSFSGRYDGYSKLINNRWGFFPGVSAGWNVHKEKFMEGTAGVVTSLKLRAGYGQNGNVDIVSGPYDLQGLYGQVGKYDAEYGILLTDLAYPNLEWEKTTSTDFAVEATLFDRLSLEVNFFQKKTSGLLASVPYPSVTGAGSMKTNNGSTRSRGLELNARYNVVRTKDWRVDVGINATYVRSRILKLPANGNERNRQGGIEVYNPKTGKPMWVEGYQEGQEYGDMYAYILADVVSNENELWDKYGWYVDVFPAKTIYGPRVWETLTEAQQAQGQLLAPGDAVWHDVNGDGRIDKLDQLKVGNQVPRWTGGASVTVSWKGLTFDANFDYATGYVNWDKIRRWHLACSQQTFNTISDVRYTWTAENPEAKLPAFLINQGGKGNYRKADFLSSRQDYICARNMSLTYKLPRKLLESLHIKDLEVSVTGQNLFYITNSTLYSPEYGANIDGGYGTPRSVIFSLKATF